MEATIGENGMLSAVVHSGPQWSADAAAAGYVKLVESGIFFPSWGFAATS
jgi:hypothetical protein